MAATRGAAPLDIYQDPTSPVLAESFPTTVDKSFYTALPRYDTMDGMPPMNGAANVHHHNLHPYERPSTAAPLKSNPIPVSRPAPLNHLAPSNANMARFPPHHQRMHSTDSLAKHPAPPMGHRPTASYHHPMYNSFPSHPGMDQENMQNPFASGFAFGLDGAMDPPPKAHAKHALTDSTPLRPTKKQKTAIPQEPVPIPAPGDMPPVHDDGKKPPFSYANMIGMAILRSPQRRLTLAQIYKWISDHFSFYRTAESGWQNSIRHNLSLSKAFMKVERPKDDPGKGHYWVITPGHEQQFLHGKPIRRTASTTDASSMSFINATQSDVARPSSSHTARPSSSAGPSVVAAAPKRKNSIVRPPSSRIDSAKIPTDDEPSSDATILASDTDNCHLGRAGAKATPLSRTASREPHLRSSPPPVEVSVENITSSPPPPVPVHSRRVSFSRPASRPVSRRGTPPPSGLFPPATRSGDRNTSRKRKLDSGYYSSIDSSARRFNPNERHPASSLGDMSKRRGRAEEEIARIRRGSFADGDSPTKSLPGSRLARWPSLNDFSSSPLRLDEDVTSHPHGTASKKRKPGRNGIDADVKGPMTPPVVFKRPARPPPSVSPHTSLMNHRKMVQDMFAGGLILEELSGPFHASPVRSAARDEHLSNSPFDFAFPHLSPERRTVGLLGVFTDQRTPKAGDDGISPVEAPKFKTGLSPCALWEKVSPDGADDSRSVHHAYAAVFDTPNGGLAKAIRDRANCPIPDIDISLKGFDPYAQQSPLKSVGKIGSPLAGAKRKARDVDYAEFLDGPLSPLSKRQIFGDHAKRLRDAEVFAAFKPYSPLLPTADGSRVEDPDKFGWGLSPRRPAAMRRSKTISGPPSHHPDLGAAMTSQGPLAEVLGVKDWGRDSARDSAAAGPPHRPATSGGADPAASGPAPPPFIDPQEFQRHTHKPRHSLSSRFASFKDLQQAANRQRETGAPDAKGGAPTVPPPPAGAPDANKENVPPAALTAADLLTLSSDDDEQGVDLTQGFERIGARIGSGLAVSKDGSPARRPRMARSATFR